MEAHIWAQLPRRLPSGGPPIFARGGRERKPAGIGGTASSGAAESKSPPRHNRSRGVGRTLLVPQLGPHWDAGEPQHE